MRRMRRLVPVIAGLALVASMSGCNWPPGTRFVHRVFPTAQVTQDVVYRTATNYLGQPVNLRMDIYQPAGDTRAERPVVMWMHGGGFTTGNEGLMAAYAEDSALRGYVGVTITYRLRNAISLAAIQDAYEDAVAAVAWLKSHAAQYRIDPDAVVVGGHSAGAVNAANVLFRANPSPAAGGVVLSGMHLNGPTAGDPPAIVHHGTADTVVSYDLGVNLCEDTRAAGNTCIFFSYQDQGHLIPYQEPAATQIKERTADAIFEQVLLPLGYPVERIPAAA